MRKLVGQIRLDPTQGDIGKPYYTARTAIDTLAIMEPPPDAYGAEGGSDSLHWWTRTRRIRTAAEVPFEVALLDTSPPPIYQRIARKALHLQELGLSRSAIARRLAVDEKTVAKAIRWLQHQQAPAEEPRDSS